MGRHPKEIDAKLVEYLASINCTDKEIAAACDCALMTLTTRFRDVIDEGREKGRCSLKRAMWKKAIDEGNPTMQIWLSKNLLGYKDQAQIEHALQKTARLVIDMGDEKNDLPEPSKASSLTLSEDDFKELPRTPEDPAGSV